mmetsp:Transcript_23245/g.71512  ORF Transcript_23245/g.71512 Transcript_23245/m.71512 type:complete len:215 (+) Transcript_23245:1163-1807(+)
MGPQEEMQGDGVVVVPTTTTTYNNKDTVRNSSGESGDGVELGFELREETEVVAADDAVVAGGRDRRRWWWQRRGWRRRRLGTSPLEGGGLRGVLEDGAAEVGVGVVAAGLEDGVEFLGAVSGGVVEAGANDLIFFVGLDDVLLVVVAGGEGAAGTVGEGGVGGVAVVRETHDFVAEAAAVGAFLAVGVAVEGLGECGVDSSQFEGVEAREVVGL